MVPPHFIVIGAQKSGTTSLFTYFTGRPDYAAPSCKEIHYFDYQ